MSDLLTRLQEAKKILRRASELELSTSAVQKLKWFVYAAEHKGNVSLACRHFGIARSTFLRWAERFSAEDPSTLEEHSRRPHSMRQPETDPQVIERIRRMRTESPLLGKQSIAEKLLQEYQIELSASTIGRIIARHNLFFADTPSHRQKRAVERGIEERKDTSPTESTIPLFTPELGLSS